MAGSIPGACHFFLFNHELHEFHEKSNYNENYFMLKS